MIFVAFAGVISSLAACPPVAGIGGDAYAFGKWLTSARANLFYLYSGGDTCLVLVTCDACCSKEILTSVARYPIMCCRGMPKWGVVYHHFGYQSHFEAAPHRKRVTPHTHTYTANIGAETDQCLITRILPA